MKKTLKITGIVVASLLVLMIVLPIAFKGKIRDAIVNKGNEMIDARFDFGGIGISLFKHFPSVSATLRDFYIVGVDRFEGDTLISAGRVTVAFNLMSLFGDDGYEVSRVALDRALLNAIVLEDGKANWDIMKPAPEEQPGDTTAASDIRIKLKNLAINNLRLAYDDRAGKMYASVADFGATMSGDLGASRSVIKLKALAEGIDFRSGGIGYLNGAEFETRINLDADLDAMKFTLQDNMLRINALEAMLDGWVAVADDATDMDLTFSTPQIDFKNILSLIPAVYAKDFASVQTTGQVSLGGWAKGRMAGDALPAFEVKMNVADATFRYPDLPAGVTAINIDAKAENPGGTADATVVTVNPLSFNMAGNPFKLTAVVSTPVSDAAFDVSAHGVIDLGKVREVYPLDSMELNGLIDAAVTVAGRMSYIEAEQYDKMKAEGKVSLTNMLLRTAGNPDVDIKKSVLTFSPRYLDLSETNLLVGKNDLTLDSRVENYMGYVLKDEALHGKLNLRSTYLNVSDLLGSGTPETTPADTSAMTVIEVPKNLDLDITAALTKVIYDNITLDNVQGRIVVRDGKADMQNLSMNTLGGNVKLTGTYSTAQSVEQPEFAAALAMTGLSFAETFRSLTTIQKLVPLFENLEGNFSGSMNLTTKLDQAMSPVLQTMNGTGSLSTKDLGLSKVGVISEILSLTKLAGVADKKVRDMKVSFTVTDGRVQTNPFDIKLGDAAINLSGSTGLDQTIDYTGKVSLPAAVAAATRMSNVNLKIGGTFTSPKVSVDLKDAATQVVKSLVGDAVGDVGKKLGVDLSDAQKQKETLVETARKGGELIMENAQKQADALVDKAKDPLSKLAAQKAANTILVQAQQRVDAMVEKATIQGDSIIARAKAGN